MPGDHSDAPSYTSARRRLPSVDTWDLPGRTGSMTLAASEAGFASGRLGMQIAHFRKASLLLAGLLTQLLAHAPAAEEQTFRSDEWITECSIGTSDCSITVPFWQTSGERTGSFALV